MTVANRYLVCSKPISVKCPFFLSRTTDTQWRQKSKISEKLGQCGRQISFGRTKKFGSGSEFSVVQWRLFPLWASVVHGTEVGSHLRRSQKNRTSFMDVSKPKTWCDTIGFPVWPRVVFCGGDLNFWTKSLVWTVNSRLNNKICISKEIWHKGVCALWCLLSKPRI